MPVYRFSDITDIESDWIWPNWLPRGTVSSITGDPGIGKTQVLLTVAKIVALGGEFPDGHICEPGIVLIFDGENGLQEEKRRLKNMGVTESDDGSSNIYIFSPFRAEGQPEWLNFVKHTQSLEKIVAEVKPDWVIVDPLVAFHEQKEISAPDMRKLTNIQMWLAQRYNCAWTFLQHPSKDREAKGMWRMRASGDLIAGPRIQWSVNVKNASEDLLVFQVDKINNAPFPDSLLFRIDEMGVVHWTGETVPHSKVETRSQRDKTAAWLTTTIRETGKISSKDLQDAAYKAGISWMSIRRLCPVIGIKPRKAQGEQYGHWYYELPKEFDF